MGRLIRISVILVVLTGASVLIGQVVSAQQPVNPEVDPNADILDDTIIERGDLTVTISGSGALSPVRDVTMAFEVSAPVVEVLVEAGQQVEQGDILARLDTADYEAAVEDALVALERQRVSYESLTAAPRDVDIAAAQAAVNSALASASAASTGAEFEDVEIARLQTELARNQLWQTQLNRDLTMQTGEEFRGGQTGAGVQNIQLQAGTISGETQIAITEAQYASVANEGPDTAALGSAAAQLAQAQVALDRLVDGASDIEVQQAEIALDQAELRIQEAQLAVDKAVLVAPFAGVVAENNLVVGELPPVSQPAILLLDTQGYYVDLTIDETDIASVQLGQTVELALDALPDEAITGTVSRVAILPSGEGQLVTYTVRVLLGDTDAPLRAGMSATATVIVSDLRDVVIVPNRFIRIDRLTGDAFVTVEQDDGAFTEVQLELGLRNETDTQVLSGLQEGQRVVLLPRATFNPLGG